MKFDLLTGVQEIKLAIFMKFWQKLVVSSFVLIFIIFSERFSIECRK